jgi:hypothetical protein
MTIEAHEALQNPRLTPSAIAELQNLTFVIVAALVVARIPFLHVYYVCVLISPSEPHLRHSAFASKIRAQSLD